MKKGIVIALIYLFLASCVAAVAVDQAATETANQTVTHTAPAPVQVVAVYYPTLFDRASDAVKSGFSWIISRDYLSVGRNLFKWSQSLSIGVKIVAVILFLVFLVVIWNYTLRNSRANNLRRARKHHLNGEKAHARGDEEGAKSHYKRAEEYREKAQEQW